MSALSYQQLREQHPEAWAALPDCYQNDSCLTFYTDVNGNLCADFDLGGTFLYSPKEREWLEG